jgi:serine/threonine protein kinase/WD40 repeat protein
MAGSQPELRAVFCEAVERTTAQAQAEYLDQACEGKPELRARVDALLQARSEVSGFLQEPTGNPTIRVAEGPASEGAGTVIGPYKLLQQIGEGGMGTVFMAEQTQPVKRKVALKVIKPGMDSRQVIARFEAERQTLALMDHVNIARVLDAGTVGQPFQADSSPTSQPGKADLPTGRPYFVMELVYGVPITKYCDDNQLTPRERLELFVPVCQAIQHAHQKGIIHRDIKPSNVMITLYDGKPVPKVIDFGVAKATEQKLTERTLFTQYGTMVGTLEYMSPEQAEMSALGVDTRSDIYSLGVLLYQLLTGSTPLNPKRVREAAYAEVLRMIKEEEPPRPSTRLSDSGEALASISAQRHTEPAKLAKLVRGELDWIVMKCLEKDRNRRYETANGFAADVQRYLNDEPVQACPPSAWYWFRKLARRNKGILATAGVIVLALVLGTAISTWQAIRATEAEGLARTRLAAETEAKNATREQLGLTEQAQEQATRRLYRSLVAQAQASRLSRRSGQRFETLKTLTEAVKIARDLNLPEERLLELRNAAIACLALADLQIAKEWNGWPTGSHRVDFDSTLERYARADRQGVVSIRRVADDAEICCLQGMGPGEVWPWFSPDGQFLGLSRGYRIKVWKLASPEPVVVVEELSALGGAAFSPDSKRLAIGHADGSLRLYELPSGRQLKQLEGVPRARARWFAFHPEGRQLAFICATGIQVYDLETGRILADLPQPPGAENVSWHPDGKTLAVVGDDRIIHIWDVATRKPIIRLEGHKNVGINFAYNHVGDLLASICWDGRLRLWDPRTGQQLFNSPWHALTSLRFSPDQNLLAAGIDGNKLQLWEVTSACGYRTLVRDPVLGRGEYQNCAISPKGRIVAAAMNDGVGLWDLTSGRPLTFLPIGSVPSIMFEPSGALLTSGASMLRFSIQAHSAAPEVLRIGKAQKLPFPGNNTGAIASSRDGGVVAQAQPFQDGALVGHPDLPEPPIKLSPHKDVRYIDVSPDGRLVATGSHWGTKVKVWEARTRKLVKELPVEGGSWVRFSPDGKWLATTGGGCQLWAVDSWQAGPHIGGGALAFTPDGKILAVEIGYGVVRLVNPDTGREYARLEDPNQDRAYSIAFSPDGTQLLATTNDSHSIHVWDLRVIREQLVKMQLDWDPTPYPPAKSDDRKALRVEVDLGNLDVVIQAQASRQQASGFLRSKQWDKAIGAYAQAIELEPKNADTLNHLAWLLATCPDGKSRDPGRAVELAARACQLTPHDGNAWNTLGVAQYRADDWKAAVVTLAKSTELLDGKQLSFNAFFLAMAHWQLGNKEEARRWHDQAVQWMDKNKPQDEELLRFRAEAAEMMSVEKKKD